MKRTINLKGRSRGVMGVVLLVLVELPLASGGTPPAGGMTTADGPATFQKTYGGIDEDIGWAVSGPLADGGFLLVGVTGIFFDVGLEEDIYAVRIDSSGNVLWSKTYGGSDDEVVYTAAVSGPLADGGFLLVGVTTSFGAGGDMDMYAVRIDRTGTSGCNEMSVAPSGGSVTSRVNISSTQVGTHTPKVMSPTTWTSAHNTQTNTLCSLAPTSTLASLGTHRECGWTNSGRHPGTIGGRSSSERIWRSHFARRSAGLRSNRSG
jgi:hypothetical protein